MQLAELLKQRRRRTGLSANDVADRAEVGRSYYFEIEQGKRANISLVIAARLSQVLKISLKDLAAAAVGREKRRMLERSSKLKWVADKTKTRERSAGQTPS